MKQNKKVDLSILQLQTLDSQNFYSWTWLPFVGTAGGILVGVNGDMFEILNTDNHEYCISCLLKNKRDAITWRFVSVYGSAYEEHKLDFINELHTVMSNWMGPTMIGGDFNIVRNSKEKSSGNVNQMLVNLFNDCANKFGLIELKNSGRLYTWSNNQANDIMATMDRILVSTCWEQMYPASQVRTLARVGSDHTPLVFDTGALVIPKVKQYIFEKWWLQVDGFREVVEKAWNVPCHSTNPLDL